MLGPRCEFHRLRPLPVPPGTLHAAQNRDGQARGDWTGGRQRRQWGSHEELREEALQPPLCCGAIGPRQPAFTATVGGSGSVMRQVAADVSREDGPAEAADTALCAVEAAGLGPGPHRRELRRKCSAVRHRAQHLKNTRAQHCQQHSGWSTNFHLAESGSRAFRYWMGIAPQPPPQPRSARRGSPRRPAPASRGRQRAVQCALAGGRRLGMNRRPGPLAPPMPSPEAKRRNVSVDLQ